MRREVCELVERCRELGIRQAPVPGNPEAIRLAGDRSTFPAKLYRVAVALEAVDRAGAATLTGADPLQDAARLRAAIDGVFSWMKAGGMDISEPHALVSIALGVTPKAAAGAYRPPTPAPPDRSAATRRPAPYRLLKLLPGIGEKVSLESLLARAAQAQAIERNMGAAASWRR